MPDQHVYAIASGKGGVGKTTTAVTLGAVAAAGGRSVVVVDADLGMPDVAGVLDVPAGGTTVHDVLAGEADPVAGVVGAPGGVDVLAGAGDVEKFGGADPAALRDVVAALREAYDLVLLDTGAGLSHATVVPLGLADAVVLVTTPDPVAVGDAARTRDLARRFGGGVAGVVVVGIGGGDLEPGAVAEALDVPLLASVPADPAVRESAGAGRPLPVAAPDGPATAAYRRATAALLGAGDDADEPDDDGDEAGGGDEAGDGEAVDDGGSEAGGEVDDAAADDADAGDGGRDAADGDDGPPIPDADGVTLPGDGTVDAVVPDGEASVGPDGPADGTADEPSIPGDDDGVSFPGARTDSGDDSGVTFSGPGDDEAAEADGSVGGADDDAATTGDDPDGEPDDDSRDGDDSPDEEYVRGGDEESDETDGDGAADEPGGGESADDPDGDESADDSDDGESRSLLSRLTGGLLGG